MLKFTKVQIYKCVSIEENVNKIGAHLFNLYPEMQVKSDTYSDNLVRAYSYATELGFSTDQHILDIVETCFLLGGTVYHHKLFQRIVNDVMWHNEEKCQAIREHVIAPFLKEQS